MGNGGVDERNPDHALLGVFAALANGVSDFTCFAEADADFASLVAHHNECAKAEPATAFHNFGGPIDEDDFFGQTAVFLVPKALVITTTRTTSAALPAAL